MSFPLHTFGQEKNIQIYQEVEYENLKTEETSLFSLEKIREEEQKEKSMQEWKELDKSKILPFLFSLYDNLNKKFSRYEKNKRKKSKRRYFINFHHKNTKGVFVNLEF